MSLAVAVFVADHPASRVEPTEPTLSSKAKDKEKEKDKDGWMDGWSRCLPGRCLPLAVAVAVYRCRCPPAYRKKRRIRCRCLLVESKGAVAPRLSYLRLRKGAKDKKEGFVAVAVA